MTSTAYVATRLSGIFLFLWKWWRWLNPVAGWKRRYRAYTSGQKIWHVPGNEKAPPVVPFPVEWIPHRLPKANETSWTDEDLARGFINIESTCSESGVSIAPGTGVLCLRCAIPLHPDQANMVDVFDPPHCNRCKIPMLLA